MQYLNEIRAFSSFNVYIKNYDELNELEYQLKKWEKKQAEQVQRTKLSKIKIKTGIKIENKTTIKRINRARLFIWKDQQNRQSW